MERTLLIAVQLDRRYGPSWPAEDELRELEELARSAGCRSVGHSIVRRHTPIAGTFIGSGKLQELARQVDDAQAQVVIFNQELSPAQQRNIEDLLRVKTIDRTQLILDIFAQRARSQEGKVQVELAQLRYLMPRLVGKGVLLSRLGGGIGTRGPGEQKLEVDRRRIRRRITKLNDELNAMARRREATRQRRREARVPVVALVGYTNAGKTTLLNMLTGAAALAEDRPFTTLDPLAKRLRLPAPPSARGGPETDDRAGTVHAGEEVSHRGGGATGTWVVITDTVGFLHQLPHHLIEAFKATLEETQDAHVLLHVLDASHPLALEQAEAVQEVLVLLQLRDKPVITVLNKRDQVRDPHGLRVLEPQVPNPVAISALRGEGLEELLKAIAQQLVA